jgi:serine/threonine protein kinase
MIGETVSHYRILEKLGSGGMGVVYKAEDRDSALQILRKGVEENFCGYPAMDKDPSFASIRSTPEFAEIRKMGMACQQRFLSHRASSKN